MQFFNASRDIDWKQLITRRESNLCGGNRNLSYLLLPEVERLLSEINDDTTRLAVYTLWVSGARVSELLTLRPIDFSLKDDTFVSLPTFKNRLTRETNPPRRVIALTDDSYLKTLQRHFKAHRAQDYQLLFPFTRNALRYRLNLAGRKAKLPLVVNSHTLRHSYAINHLLHGRTLQQIQSWLGHRKKAALNVYLRACNTIISHHGEGTPFRSTIANNALSVDEKLTGGGTGTQSGGTDITDGGKVR